MFLREQFWQCIFERAILKLLICWLSLYNVTITKWSCRIWTSHLRYAVSTALIQTATHHLGTIHWAQRVAPTWFYHGFPGCWHSTSLKIARPPSPTVVRKHNSSLTVCLIYRVVHNHMNKTKLCLNMSNYVDKLLVVKSLRHTFVCWKNITYFNWNITYVGWNITHFGWYTILHTSAEILHTSADIQFYTLRLKRKTWFIDSLIFYSPFALFNSRENIRTSLLFW